MNIADIFFAAHLDDSKLQIDSSTAGDKAGTTLGGHISTSLSKTAFVGFAAKAGAQAFDLLKNSVGEVTAKIGEFVDKAREEEVVSARLDQALASNVVGWNGNRTAIDAFISKQTSLGFTIADVTAQMAQLVAATGSVSKAQEYLATAEDLARLTGNSLADSVDALTRVQGGSSKILKSLGIDLGKNATSTQALAAVQKIAAGQAEKYGTTSAGAMDKFNAKVDEAQVKIGQKLIPVVNKMIDAFSTALDIIDNDKHADALVQQTKDFAALNLSVDTYKNALAGVLEQYKLLANDPGATQQQKDDLLAVMVVLQDQINLEKDAIPIIGDMSAAAVTAFASMRTAAAGPKEAAAQVEAFRQAAIYAQIASDKAAPAVRAFFDVFDVAIGKGNVAQDTLDLRASNKAVDDAREARDKFKKNTPEWRKANLELTVTIGDQAAATQRLRLDQAKLFLQKPDAKTHAALLKYFSSVGLGVRELTGDLKAAWDALFGLTKPESRTVKFTLTTGKGGPQKFAAGGAAAAGVPIIVGDAGRPEVFVPDVNGRISPSIGAYAASVQGGPGMGGGNTYNVNVTGLLRARTASEIGDHLRRLSDFGMLTTPEPA